MDRQDDGNERWTTTQSSQGNGNLKGDVPMEPVLTHEVVSATQAMAQQMEEAVNAARTARVKPASWRRVTANSRPGRVRLDRPLLFVGIGGSGRRIATRVKAAFIERFGHVPENAVILAYDSADDPISVREGRTGRVVTLEPGSQFFLLDRVPLAGLRRTPERHPDLAERLGDDLFRIRRASIQDGAAGERGQGLVSLMWNAPAIARRLEAVIRRLVERTDDLGHALAVRRGINVVVAGSTCGGQNSGGMFDFTYLVREALLAVGELGESSRVLGVAVLPGAFPGVRGPNFDANTHAFFTELDALQAGRGFHARYPGGIQVASKEPPFDVVLAFDGVDEHGMAFANHEEVCELAAQAIGLMLSSEVGAQEIFTALNEAGVLQGVSPAGHGLYLATAGQSVIRFPAQATAGRCAAWQAAEIADYCLADPTPLPSPSLAGQAEGRIGFAGAQALRQRLSLNANGAPYDVQMVPPASLEQAPQEEQPTMARAFVTHFMQRRVHGDAFGAIVKTTESLTAELRADITAGLASVLRGGQLAPAAAWLAKVEADLQAECAGLRAETERLAAGLESHRKALEASGAAVDRAAEALFLFRKSQMRAAMNRYLDDAGQFARLTLQQRVADAAGEALQTGLRAARDLARQLAEAQARLQQARSLLSGRAAEFERLAVGRSEINLATPELAAQLYAQHRREPAELALQAAGQAEDLLGWGELTAEALAARLTEAAAQAFAPLTEITVEDVLAIRWDDRSAGQWISRLSGLAAGAWNQDRALMPDGGASQASFLTIGVPDATQSIFANAGYTLVSTHDPERIVALRTVYGASFDTLKGAAGWRRAYEAAQRRGLPLHVVKIG
jgi:hypothetical protein